jgi:tRNA(fMet)-specific endonuclease VapC
VSSVFLLDTNVFSEALRPQPRQHILQKITRHEYEIAIASVVWHELLYGIERLPPSRRRVSGERYLNEIATTMPMINYDRAAAEWHARERARLVARGQTPPILDGQIAAIAAVNRLVVVTFNLDHFNRFEGLRIESW